MILSFVCICGANYEVEFEPVDGQLAGEVRCPSCGADATAIARKKLAQTLADAPVEKAPAAVEEKPAFPTACATHAGASIEIFCFVCKRPMCKSCMEQHGFVCSSYCERRGVELGLDIPVYEKQRAVVEEHQHQSSKLSSCIVGAIAVGLIGFWIWYVAIASRPHLEFRLPLTEMEHPLTCRFVGPHQVLLTTHRRVAIYDVEARKELWSVALNGSQVCMTEHDLWVTAPDAVVRLDRQTGKEISRTDIPGMIQQVVTTDGAVVVVSASGTNATQLTQIALATGAVTTTGTPVPSTNAVGFVESDIALEPLRVEFVPAGADLVRMEARLVKANIVAHTSMKKENSQGVSAEIRVTETAAFAEDVMNEMRRQRSGGVRQVDESTYAVNLHRYFSPRETVWSGEVTGRPSFFALSTVDVLLAGQQLMVFDKNNHPLWNAKLAYEIGRLGDAEGHAPCVEVGASLYVFDQGVLTAYELRTGTVRWRLPSVGISKLAFDDQGLLYISTTTAGPELIQYPDQINFHDKIVPVIMKVDPASGKILWRVEQVGDSCYAAGRYVYFTRTQGFSPLTLLSAIGSGNNFRVHRINPRNGRDSWEYYQPRSPLAIDFQGRRLLLAYDDEVLVLKFFSL